MNFFCVSADNTESNQNGRDASYYERGNGNASKQYGTEHWCTKV